MEKKDYRFWHRGQPNSPIHIICGQKKIFLEYKNKNYLSKHLTGMNGLELELEKKVTF